ncbi:hypothetical protein HNR42_000404 [Deinobacterium chartae]|uniref:Uncharacterized protein n=1 Tax=Deinobacterium chartae TaxID=521158 RepID=A0A841HYK4_9DEIO|nr:hypothetical protein [Deinobacterium chartae]
MRRFVELVRQVDAMPALPAAPNLEGGRPVTR